MKPCGSPRLQPAQSSGFWLIISAVSLVGIYNIFGGTRFPGGILPGLEVAPIVDIIVMMLIIFFRGTFLEWIAIVSVTVPVFAPVVVQLGHYPVWFDIFFPMNPQINMLSPPFGPTCFYLKCVAPRDVTLQEVFLAILQFICLKLIGWLLSWPSPKLHSGSRAVEPRFSSWVETGLE